MTNYNFTENEARAVKTLYLSCLGGMGGSTFAHLEGDPFTWVNASDLMKAGWTRHAAIGTFGALITKGAVEQYSPTEWCLDLTAAKWASEN